ncbi:MAG TPA: MFS transporter [Acidobacteriaceae bacterium]|nr:MFS transporter [Acidobacteriaceae bacterium]
MRRAILLPIFFITYSLAYLDRANFGFGAAAGMSRTLHITDNQLAWLGAMFFLGYFLFQVPGMLLARRVSATRVVFIALVIWGVLATLTGILRSFALLCVDRFVLGLAESVTFPAMLFLLTRWFPRSERSRANSILLLGNPVTVLWMSAITGFLTQHLGWQRTFIIEGLPAILWSAVWIATVRDSPGEARWLDPAQATELEAAITQQQSAPELAREASATLLSVLLRGDVLILCAQYIFWSLGVYGFVLWLPAIIHKASALSLSTTGLLAAAPYLLAIAGEVGMGHVSDRTGRTAPLVWPFLMVGGVAMMGSFLFAPVSFWLAFACLVLACGAMYAPYPPFFSIIPDRVPRQHAGEVFALVNSCGALGGFLGTYFVGWLRGFTHSDRAGEFLMALALILAALLTLALPKRRPTGEAYL